MPAFETDQPLHESFDNGVGSMSNAWNVDASTPGEIVLHGGSAMMQPATGPDAGQGYGRYTINAKFEGSEPGAAIIFWPGDDQWPGQEIDMGEMAADGSGRQYGAVHWDNNGQDAYETVIFDDVEIGVFHDYTMIWTPDAVTYEVDGEQVGRITENVPRDYDDGGMNNTIGFLNNNPDSTLTVRQVDYIPLGAGGGQGPAPQVPDAPDAGGGNGGGGDTGGGDGGGYAPEPGGDVDWNALMASDDTDWNGLVAEGVLDWTSIGAAATAHYEATGAWPII